MPVLPIQPTPQTLPLQTTTGAPGNPLLRVLSNEQLIQPTPAPQDNMESVVTGLAGHVRKAFEAARSAKENIQKQLIENMYARKGQYTPEQLAKITEANSADVYVKITASKCRTAEAWIRDVLFGTERPFTLSPTPVPDMHNNAEAMAAQQLASLIKLGISRGLPPPQPDVVENQLARMTDEIKNQIEAEAKLRASREEDKIDDYLRQGGFYDALSDFIANITTFKAAFIQGPIVRKKPTLKWVQNPATQQWEAQTQDDFVFEFDAPSPFDIYTAPSARKLGEGYVIRRHRLTRASLDALRGAPGYDTDAINNCLDDYGTGGLNEWLAIDNDRDMVADRIGTFADPTAYIDALQYFGSVQGNMLLEWGMDISQVPDPFAEYNVECWVIGPYTIKAVLNNDPLGRIPIYGTSWQKMTDSVWGESITDILEDQQRIANGAARALAQNMAFASGPMVDVNTSRLAEDEEVTSIHPWMVVQTITDPTGVVGEAIRFFQPASHADELLGIIKQSVDMADDICSIPKFLAGENPGTLGRTSSGVSMILQTAQKGLKAVMYNIDQDVIVKVIEMMHFFIMRYDNDHSIKGDVQVVARGAQGLLMKDAVAQRRSELMGQLMQTPAGQSVAQQIGPKPIISIMRETVKSMDMNPDDILPDPDSAGFMNQLMQAVQPPQPQGPQPQPAPQAQPAPQGQPQAQPAAQGAQ